MSLGKNVHEDVNELFTILSSGNQSPRKTFTLRDEEVTCNGMQKPKKKEKTNPPTLPFKKGTSTYYD